MKYFFLLYFIFLINSCTVDKVDKSNSNNEILKRQERKLHPLVNKALNLYVKEYPIPDNKKNNYKYKIEFSENEFSIMRIGFTYPKQKKIELKGSYYTNDSILILIYDRIDKNSSRFYKIKQLVENKVVLHYKENYDETFPPIWNYKIFSNKLFLIGKDTIWNDWKK